jgi:hypothetical protein
VFKIINLATGVEYTYSVPGTCRRLALRFAYAREHDTLSSLAARMYWSEEWMQENYPIIEGEKTLGIGDWCAFKEI